MNMFVAENQQVKDSDPDPGASRDRAGHNGPLRTAHCDGGRDCGPRGPLTTGVRGAHPPGYTNTGCTSDQLDLKSPGDAAELWRVVPRDGSVDAVPRDVE